MVKTKNKIFSIALCLILILAMVLGGIKIAGGREGVSATTHHYTEATLSGSINNYNYDGDGTGLWWYEILDNDERFTQEKYKSITITNTSEPTGAIESFDVSVEGDERLKAYYIPNGDLYDCVIYGDCEKIYAPVNSGFLFGDCELINYIFENLETINFECFDTSKTEVMFGMFECHENYGKLSTIIGLDNFSTSNVTNMSDMFGGCSSLTSLDLSSFDMSNVEKTNRMFKGSNSLTTICASSSNIDTLKEIVVASKLSADIVKLKPADVEETGIDLYSGLAISGAMLVVACGCAVVMSKMKRKQSI